MIAITACKGNSIFAQSRFFCISRKSGPDFPALGRSSPGCRGI